MTKGLCGRKRDAVRAAFFSSGMLGNKMSPAGLERLERLLPGRMTGRASLLDHTRGDGSDSRPTGSARFGTFRRRASNLHGESRAPAPRSFANEWLAIASR